MSADLGKAYIQIVPSARGISGSIRKELNGEAQAAGDSAGQAIGGNMVSKIISIAKAAAIGKVLKDTIMEGAKLEQSFGGLDTIYEDAAEAAKKYAYEAQKAGISANDYAEQAVSFGAGLKQAFGGDSKKAIEAANVAIMDMTDNAAKMGTPIESIQNAYQGFAKQNYTMLDNLKLGYGGTKTEMERLLADAQKISGVEYNIDNLGDVYDAIHVIQEDLGLTGVAADEAATTLSGSFGAAKAALSNFLADMALGNDVSASLQTLLDSVVTFVGGNLIPAVGSVLVALPPAIMQTITTLLPQIMDGGLQLINSLASGMSTGVPDFITGLTDMLMTLVSTVMTNLPLYIQAGGDLLLGLVDGIITSLPSLLESAGEIWTTLNTGIMDALPGIWDTAVNIILELVNGIIENLPAIAEAGMDIITNFWTAILEHAPTLISSGFEILGNLISGILQAIPDLLAAIPTVIMTIWNAITDTDWLGLGSNVLSAIIDGLLSLLGTLGSTVLDLAQSAWDTFKNIDWLGLGATVVSTILTGLLTMLGILVTGAVKLATGAFDAIIHTDWLGLGVSIVTNIVTGLGNFLSNLVSKAEELATSAFDAITNTDWLGLGGDIIDGIVEGLSNAGGAVKDFLLGIANDALDNVKEFFGIKSPSRVMRDQVGKMIGQGMALGILDSEDLVEDAMKDLTDVSMPDIGINSSLDKFAPVSPEINEDKRKCVINVYPSEGMDENAIAERVNEEIARWARNEELVYA